MEAGHVIIDVVGQEPEDWRVAHVEVAAGIWKGAFRWEFLTGELRRFGQDVQELFENLSGAASLEPTEPNLTLKMIGDGKGHITVKGRAEAGFATGTYLVFALALDQTELPAIAAALIAVDP